MYSSQQTPLPFLLYTTDVAALSAVRDFFIFLPLSCPYRPFFTFTTQRLHTFYCYFCAAPRAANSARKPDGDVISVAP